LVSDFADECIGKEVDDLFTVFFFFGLLNEKNNKEKTKRIKICKG
jgi:hypothetical protein